MSKRRVWLTLLIALLGLIIGFEAGGYIVRNRVLRTVENIPASPIIVGTEYQKDKNQLIFSVLNPGPTPLTLQEYTITFAPGKKTEQEAYVMSHIPLGVTIRPFEVAVAVIKLKKEALPLEVGDVVTTSLFYTHPLSQDIYTVIHPYLYEKAPGGEQQQQQEGGEGGNQ